MPKRFDLKCAAGKTARVWLQGKGGALKQGHAFVLTPAHRISRVAAPGADRRQHRPRERHRVRSGLQGAEARDRAFASTSAINHSRRATEQMHVNARPHHVASVRCSF